MICFFFLPHFYWRASRDDFTPVLHSHPVDFVTSQRSNFQNCNLSVHLLNTKTVKIWTLLISAEFADERYIGTGTFAQSETLDFVLNVVG